MATLYEYILENYKSGDVILLKDLKKYATEKNIKYTSLNRSIQRLLKSNRLCRASRNIYCLPVQSNLLNKRIESLPEKNIVVSTYLFHNDEVYGYPTGLFFMHDFLHATNQVPYGLDIVTTKKITLDNLKTYKVDVKYVRYEINKDNWRIFSILDLFNSKNKFSKKEIETIKDYIVNENIKIQDMQKYFERFPNALENMIRSEVINVFAQK